MCATVKGAPESIDLQSAIQPIRMPEEFKPGWPPKNDRAESGNVYRLGREGGKRRQNQMG